MQVADLVELGQFLKEFVQDKSLTQQYQNLIDAINQAAQNQNPERVQENLDSLLEAHREAGTRIMSPAQRRLLEDLGVSDLIGSGAANRLRRIFDEHRAHPQGLVGAIQKLQNETNQSVKRINQLIAGLGPMLEPAEQPEIGPGEGVLWLYFTDSTRVETIGDLEKAADSWNDILHHFARMPSADAGEGRILFMRKHSPLEMEIAAALPVLVPLAFGITYVLSRVEQVIRILQKAEELKQMKLKTEIVESVRQEAEKERKAITKAAADAIKKRFDCDNEARNAAEKAMKLVLAFIEDGGQLDITIDEPEPADADEGDASMTTDEISALIGSIRKNLHLLPPRTQKSKEEVSDRSAADD